MTPSTDPRSDPGPRSRATPVHDVVVLGGGPTGLTTAVLLARAGCAVVVVERDVEGPAASADRAWSSWDRPGVPHFRQVHVALPCWHRLLQREIPELTPRLRALGGAAVNQLHLNPAGATGGWQDGDERFETLTGRRPVLEAAVAGVAAAEPGVSIRRGERVDGLVTARGSGGHRVVGVRVGGTVVAADLVVDALGHRTPVPGWLEALDAGPAEERSSAGLSYYTRHYAAPGGPPTGTRGALTHHRSYSVLTLPADGDTWGLALVVSSADRATRPLRDPRCWEAAIRASGVDEGWLAGSPLSGVRPLAGLVDVVRDYAPGGVPVIGGLVAVGDAWATTSPFLGRGLSLGALEAVALRDAVTGEAGTGADAVTRRYAALLAERVEPYVRATIAFGRHRSAELAAECAGRTYRTDDPGWVASSALVAGAREDPVLLRAHTTIASLLALPAEVFAEPALRARLGQWFGASLYPADRPGRDALLEAIATPRSLTSTTQQGALP